MLLSPQTSSLLEFPKDPYNDPILAILILKCVNKEKYHTEAAIK